MTLIVVVVVVVVVIVVVVVVVIVVVVVVVSIAITTICDETYLDPVVPALRCPPDLQTRKRKRKLT